MEILDYLRQHGGSAWQQQLVLDLRLNPRAVGRKMRQMEKVGLITRKLVRRRIKDPKPGLCRKYRIRVVTGKGGA